jgi:FkbM family methyltransferase
MVPLLSCYRKFRHRLFTNIFVSIIQLAVGVLIGYYLTLNAEYLFRLSQSVLIQRKIEQNRNYLLKNTFNISPNVHIVDLTATTKEKFPCIQTKKLLDKLSTNICLYEKERDQSVSGRFHDGISVWEEEQVTRILELLIRHPHLHFIDIGANIGAYTMFVAALDRFVLAIDCFAPNLDRLRHAIQLTNVYKQVVLVQNALFTHSGQSLRLSVDSKNIGGQALSLFNNDSDKHPIENDISTNDPYIVKTITFDEILPILVARGIRGALMKIDIEGSESFVVQNGSRVFDTLDIPFIQMEWFIVRQYEDRVKLILDFFAKRNYVPMTNLCQLLDVTEIEWWPMEMYWLKRNVEGFC